MGFAHQTRALILDLARAGARPEDGDRIQAALAHLEGLAVQEARFEEITETAFAIASLDFDKRARILDDGSASDGLACAVNMLSEEIAGYIADLRDSQQSLHKTEELLRHSQKMEAVGRLSGGIAHDFNNLLSVILSYATMMLEDLPPTHPMRTDLIEIRSAGERAAELTRQLLAFSRQTVVALEVVALGPLLSGLERMLGRLVGEDIEVVLVQQPGLGRVKVDPGQIEQVIMNLVVNARDAMPTGGRVTIETRNVELDPHFCQTHPEVTPGRYVMLAVSDTGIGMDEATRSRIFEPFFTTKDVSKGTGLGLSTVFGIVHQFQGTVWVYSEPGHGSTFKVYLPETTELEARHVVASPDAPGHGHETVLLVEDDDRVRALVHGILRRSGYQVLVANGPGEAVLVCEQHVGPIDLLLTDVVMPRMSGRQLVERVTAIRPSMQVLYMSGYTDDAVVRHGILNASVAFLQKPLTPSTLNRKVRDVLDATVGPGPR